MPLKSFSNYLLENNIISATQLETGILSQHERRLLLGQLAVEKKYLNRDQVKKILALQRIENRQFGETAIKNEMLTKQQVNELMHLQSNNHLFLGYSLVQLQYIDMSDLQFLLNKFWHELEAPDIDFNLDSDDYRDQVSINQYIKAIQRFFFEEGYATLTNNTYSNYPQNNSFQIFAAEIKLSRKESGYFVVFLPSTLAIHIAETRATKNEVSIEFHQQLEICGEVIFNFNYSVCRTLKKIGYKVKHGCLYYTLPSHKRCYCVSFATHLNDFYIAYVR